MRLMEFIHPPFCTPNLFSLPSKERKFVYDSCWLVAKKSLKPAQDENMGGGGSQSLEMDGCVIHLQMGPWGREE